MEEQEFYNDFDIKLKEKLNNNFVDSLIKLMETGKLKNDTYLEIINKEIKK